MEWLFEGTGTLLLGLIIGGATGGVAGYRIAIRRQRQSQRAGSDSNQLQAGRDINVDR